MTAQIFAGNFTPGTDTVEVRGNFNAWAGATLANNPAAPNPNIYTGVVSIVAAPGSGESYKFTIYGPSGVTWESSTPKQSTPDTGASDYNRFLQLPNAAASVLPVVFFNDKRMDDYLQAGTLVTFKVDMNGAVTTDAHTFDSGAGDTVWINGEFIPWYAWYDPANPTYGPAQYQMIENPPGSGIYSNQVMVPTGKPVAFAYKYGIGIGSLGDLGPRDNEASVGQDHFRVVRSTATGAYTMSQDKFGTQYHEPCFNYPATADGQLTVGAPSGGTIPVTWLGRPGAHLQSANSLNGAWADHLNTDGTNWTSGINTTNGLLSVTNWPAIGKTFFRLVKP